MNYVVVLLITAVFIGFFSLLDLRYFGLLPLFFLIFFFSQGFQDFKIQFSHNNITEKYGLYLLGLLTFFGLFGILTFLGASADIALLILMIGQLLLWAISYLIPYQDGQSLFMHGFVFLGGVLILNYLFTRGPGGLLGVIGQVIGLWMLGFGAIYYGIGHRKTVEKKHYHYFCFLVLLGLMYLLIKSHQTLLYALDFAMLVYGAALGILTYARLHTHLAPTRTKEISLRRVLAGEKILQKTKVDPFNFLKNFFNSLKELPLFLHYLLEYVNVGLLISVLISYLYALFGEQPLHQIWYRCGVIFFLLNAFLLKKNQIFTLISRFAVALVVNFSLYISLINVGSTMQAMLPWLIARNILCGLLVLYANTPTIKKYLKKPDLIFWLLASLVAMLLNTVLLLRLEISGQLIFSLIFFYVGIQGAIAYYAVQVIKTFDLASSKKESLDQLLEQEMSSLL